MKALALLSLLSGSLLLAPFAEASRLSREGKWRKQLSEEVELANAFESPAAWAENYHGLSFFEKNLLRGSPALPSATVRAKLERRGQSLYLTAGPLEIDVTRLQSGIISVGEKEIRIDRRMSLLDVTARLIKASGTVKGKSAADALLSLFTIPAAHANIDDTCIGRWEFLHRSPYPLLDSKVGYFPHLLLAGIVLSGIRSTTAVLRQCEAQARELKELLRKATLGVKSIDCGTEESGNDRSIEFWIPERDSEGKFKTKTFRLDYSLLIAQEEAEDPEENEDTDKNKRNQPPKKKEPDNIFIFGGDSRLQEIRRMEPSPATDDHRCETYRPGDTRFQEIAAKLAPYQKIFEYIGNYDSCFACRKELELRLKSADAPSYFPPPPPPPGRPARNAPRTNPATPANGARPAR